MYSGEKLYIWQADDWPNWRYDLSALTGPLTEVSRAQGVLLGRLADVGIALRDRQGNPVAPNTFYNVPGFANNEGDWNLTAAPVAKYTTSVIQEGEFHASATVVAEFQ